MNLYMPVFKAFAEEEIRYVVVGGVATVLHGYARMTADLDLVIDLDEVNCLRAIAILQRLGYSPRVPVNPLDLARIEIRRGWIEEKGMVVFTMTRLINLPLQVDIFIEEPKSFIELWTKRVDIDIEGTTVHVVGLETLIELKTKAGRLKDLEDVRVLRELNDGSN